MSATASAILRISSSPNAKLIVVMLASQATPEAWPCPARSGADGLVNPTRDIHPKRVGEYRADMQAGLWRDLLSDPITITIALSTSLGAPLAKSTSS
jgi:hypothetical protein